MVAELKSTDGWRRPGCDERCSAVRAIKPGILGWVAIETHHPDAHEEYGLAVAGSAPPHRVVTGPLVVDLGRNTATLGDREVAFSGREWGIVVHLARHLDRFCPADEILSHAWGPEWVDSVHMLRQNISRLRARLGDGHGLIETRTGVGWRLRALPPGTAVAEIGPTRGRRIAGWARGYDRCRDCGTTDRIHEGHGLCNPCRTRRFRRGVSMTDGATCPPVSNQQQSRRTS